MRTHGRIRLALLVAVVIAGAIGLIRAGWTGGVGHTFWFWLGACFAGELLWLRLPLGRATLSMASCFNFAALLVLPREEAMVAAALGTLTAELLVLRKPPVRALFNASHSVLAVGLSSLTFGWLAGGSRDLVMLIMELRLLPFIAAAAVYYAVNRGAVTLAVAWHEGIPPLHVWRRNFGSSYELVSSGAVFSLGALIATHAAGVGLAGTLLVALPLVVACDGYRRFVGRTVADETPAAQDRRAA